MTKPWCLFLVGAILMMPTPIQAAAPPTMQPTAEAVQHRAFDFFWKESDPHTGLTKDRATNLSDAPDTHTIASTAATGYALAALPIGVEHGWITRQQGHDRAILTLKYLDEKLPNIHGFYYHFLDVHTGNRQWKCEISSIDTALLLMGARVAGQYWHGTDVQRLTDTLTERADWRWMRTEGGTTPLETAPSMGWHPESGWIPARWQGYTEAFYLYILAMGTPGDGLTPRDWDGLTTERTTLEGFPVFGGAEPLFMAQMAPGYLNVRGLQDRKGLNWWAAWHNAHLADHTYCARNPDSRKTYAEGFWGVSANDQPDGYGADQPETGHNRGTVSPTAMLSSVIFTPDLARTALDNLWQKHGPQLWGRYGFSNAFNVDQNWYDTDVIGIDLGMMLLTMENARSGLIWRLTNSDLVFTKGLKAAGFRPQRK